MNGLKESIVKISSYLFISVLFIFMVFSTVCTATVLPSNEIREPSNNSTLLFLGNMNLAPVVYLDGNTPQGLGVDIVHALEKYISQPIEIRAMNWSEAQSLVAAGDADALIQINPTDERLKIYDFSDPFLESQFSIFTRSDTIGISGPTSLRGRTVGVEPGGLPEKVLETDPLIHLTTIQDFHEGFTRLNEGSLDAVVVDYRVGSYVLATHSIHNIKAIGDPIASSYSSIAVKKGNTRLLNEINAALRMIKADGTYQKILTNWRPTEGVFETREQIDEGIFRTGFLILLIVILIGLIWGITIQKELKRRKDAEEKLTLTLASLDKLVHERTIQLSDTNKKLTDEIEKGKLREEVLRRVNHKFTLLSSITRHDIGNQLQILFGYLGLARESELDPSTHEFIENAYQSSLNIERQISFTRDYEDIGVHTPVWQDINAVIGKAVVHFPIIEIQILVEISGIEVYADPLLEKVFFNLIDNANRYGETLTRIRFSGFEGGDGYTIVCEDDGVGIPVEVKSKIFNREYFKHTGFGLNLSREILDITGITISETGIPGKGARFEIRVPNGGWRCSTGDNR